VIQIVAWIGALFCLVAGIGMLVAPSRAGNLPNPRLLGIVFLVFAGFNIYLATQILGVN
jgi:hypothetical protein